MAAAVSRTIGEGGILVAEAGTGTGKTLAYLIPAILNGRRTLISTGTKNLQEQIVDKDVPLLQRALGVSFSATCMKGRGNYLCLHRFEALRGGPEQAASGASSRKPRAQSRFVPTLRPQGDHFYLPLIEAWAARTETGDRAELDEVPEDLPLWGDIAATTENCLGAECPRYSECFVTRMRQRAAESDLVIVNHHLLCADAAVRQHSFGEVIPECSVAVIDEAHQLEDVATQYFGITVSDRRVDELVRDAQRVTAAAAGPDREHVEAIRRAVGHLDRHARAFFVELLNVRPGSEVATAPATGGLYDERRRVAAADMSVVADRGLGVIGSLDEIEGAVGLTPEATEDIRAIGRRATELRDALRFLLQASDPAFVYFIEVRGRTLFLRAMPIDVSSIVRELVFDRVQATVVTSATLAVNGSFDYVKRRLGIEGASEIRLESEFDYRRQSILYLPRRMPDPRSREFAARATDEILDIVTRTEGRAFVLFTSYAALRYVQQRMQTSLPYPLLVQGEAPRSILLSRFRSTPNAVLLGTSSFWQGVDVAGEALSCVIIDKLPFASPSDPVVQARIEAISNDGGDAFGEYQVPLAVLTLLQGMGRLLRHRTDRGVLAVLDPRLRTMGYGRRFLASFPPSPITHDVADVSRFFET
jgi:ATP-dependent DNA helicase DinG